MPHLVTITALYTGNADEIFASALDFREMIDAMSGLATYDGLPTEPGKEGETYTFDVTMWGFLKTKGHVIHIEKLDRENRILQSREHNPSIKRWDHHLTVEPEGDKARWTDAITVDAGWQTPFVARFCAYVYQRRHRHRQALEITSRISCSNMN